MVCLYGSLVNGFELISMTDRIVARQDERRNGVRFPANVPLTVLVGDRMIAGYTRDLSDKGVYFYLGSSESDLIGGEFSFTLKLPRSYPLNLVRDPMSGPAGAQRGEIPRSRRDCCGNSRLFSARRIPGQLR